MKTWAEVFAPTGYDLRPNQEALGNKIIETIEHGKILVGQATTGTGKSLATAIPTIVKIHEMRKAGKSTPRSVISTETITLQSQLCDKDLPFLQQVYGGFKFSKLLGRSNYLCLNRFRTKAIGNKEIADIYKKISERESQITYGEHADVSAVVGYEIPKDIWREMVGSSEDCANDSDCSEGEGCYAGKARARAMESDIVVVNHSLLGADANSKSMGSDGGILGPVDILVVDEAHKLEEVLIDQWTESTSEWEMNEHIGRVVTGIKHIRTIDAFQVSTLLEQYKNFYALALEFFEAMHERTGNDWQGSETKFALHYLTMPTNRLRDLMNRYETLGPAVTETMATTMKNICEEYAKLLSKGSEAFATKKDRKEASKAATSAKFLGNFCEILNKSLQTKDGIVSHMGTSYGVIADGWVRRKDNSHTMTIRCFPIDVSGTTAKMFSRSKATILLSATLTDLTDGSFKYFKRSLGIKDADEIDVGTAFKMDEQQLVYITQAKNPTENMTMFSGEELVDLINASYGRTLVLFTSRREIELAKNLLNQYKIGGRMPYPVYVQEPDCDKAKLVRQFKEDTDSVLLGLKSMFTGIDIPGESLSQVILCRWPLPRYSTETRMKMAYWRQAGFPKWYERESLTVFQQGAGRLIRSDKCVGVVSILDQRVYDAKSNVFRTAKLGVDSLGSTITFDPNDITKHLERTHAHAAG